MINLELIEFADLTHPKAIVAEILKQNPTIVTPIPLEEIAQAAGIKDIQYQSLDGLEGALVANPAKSEGIIIISDSARRHRQRFTLGHELGHFVIPRHGHEMNCSLSDLNERSRENSNSLQKIESEANEFSANLLMPKSIFCKSPNFETQPSIDAINKLGEVFDVSFQACANRYIDLHMEPIAIVFSYKGQVSYSSRGKEIPFWLKINRGESIPYGSLTKSANSEKARHTVSDEVDSSIWFDEKSGFSFPENVVEEVLIHEGGYVSTLLWFEDEIEEIE